MAGLWLLGQCRLARQGRNGRVVAARGNAGRQYEEGMGIWLQVSQPLQTNLSATVAVVVALQSRSQSQLHVRFSREYSTVVKVS